MLLFCGVQCLAVRTSDAKIAEPGAAEASFQKQLDGEPSDYPGLSGRLHALEEEVLDRRDPITRLAPWKGIFRPIF